MKKLLALVFILTLFASCKKTPKMVRFTGNALGTYYVVTYFDTNNRDFQKEIDSILSDFLLIASLHNPNSEIVAVNNNTDIELSPMFQDIFFKAQSISELTNGAFDFTVGPLVNAYGFWNVERIDITQEMIDKFLKLVDYRSVHIENNKIVKHNPGILIDFNAIAKGYAVDLIGDFLEQQNISSFLIDIGGEILGRGRKPDGSCWKVGIEQPALDSLSERKVEYVIDLCNAALATSGNYRRYFVKDGVRYSHTIDPISGKPVFHSLLSVTVRDKYVWRADAFATAFMVLGVEKSLELIENLKDVEAFFISSESDGSFSITKSKNF